MRLWRYLRAGSLFVVTYPLILPLTLIPVCLIWGRHLKTNEEYRQKAMNCRERDAITDKVLLIQSLFVLGLARIGFTWRTCFDCSRPPSLCPVLRYFQP